MNLWNFSKRSASYTSTYHKQFVRVNQPTSMTIVCIACQQFTSSDQTFYCQTCFIPAPPYNQGEYIGDEQTYCPSCNTKMQDNQQTSCLSCQASFNIEHLPTIKNLDKKQQDRDLNRIELAKELRSNTDQAQEMIEVLGIAHLPAEQQGVALSSLAREKMNYLSGDYNFAEAKILSDLGYGLALDHGELWAIHLTQTQFARFQIQEGHPIYAASLLQQLAASMPREKSIEELRYLEVMALLSLAHRLAGNSTVADELAENTTKTLQAQFQQMEPKIKQYLQTKNIKSEFLEFDHRETRFPRVDYIAMILVTLSEEIIARGPKDDLLVDDLILDRLLELDNVISILADMTPHDDQVFFAAQLREYIRLMSGLLWYGDTLLNNIGVTKRLLIDRLFDRVIQWLEIIPPHFWLGLRLARILEAFLRAEHWSKTINIERITNRLLNLAAKEQQPSFLYVFAEALRNTQRFAEAEKYLEQILSIRYKNILDDNLKTLVEQMKVNIQLESVGILVGVSKDAELFQSPINLEMEQVRSSRDTGSYLHQAAAEELPNMQNPVLHLLFNQHQDLVQQGIAIFGDKLATVFHNFQPSITSVKEKSFDDPSWLSPSQNDKQPKEVRGVRMDVVVMRTEYKKEPLSMIFEGKKQRIVEDDEAFLLAPSDLLLLRGIIHPFRLEPGELLQLLVDILTAQLQDPLEIYTLKAKA